jgi:hypothetical protein
MVKKILCPDGSLLVKNIDDTTALIVKEFRRFDKTQVKEAAKRILEFLKVPANPWVMKINEWAVILANIYPEVFFKKYEEDMQRIEAKIRSENYQHNMDIQKIEGMVKKLSDDDSSNSKDNK